MGIRDSRCKHPNRTRRQESAKEQQAASAGRSAKLQLARLNARGYTASRERGRLLIKLEQERG